MTPNDINRRVVAEWLQDWSNDCQERQLFRHHIMTPVTAFRVLIELCFTRYGEQYGCECYGSSRAEATAKATAWILRKGWEVAGG